MTNNNPNNQDDASKAQDPTQKSAGEDKLRHDIAQILEEVQLPERKTFKAEADKPTADPAPVAPIATMVGAQASAKSESATESPTNAPSSEPSQADANQQKKQSQSIIRPLRTLKDDLGNIVESKKMSLVRAAALESDKVRPQKERIAEATEMQKKRSRRRTSVVVGIFILVGIGMLALGAVFLVDSQRRLDVAAPENNSLMFAEQTIALSMDDLSPREAKLLLAQARDQANVTLGSITRIVPLFTVAATEKTAATERLLTSSEFLTTLGSQAPPELTRALGTDFFVGIHAIDKTAPIMVFTVSSYERAFAAMLAWESTISDGLAPFYPAVFQDVRSSGNSLSIIQFEDAVVRNFDARILKDASGEVRFLYAFPTRGILIIAESPYSFVEALSRLQAERRL
jgi:hypothetical protein